MDLGPTCSDLFTGPFLCGKATCGPTVGATYRRFASVFPSVNGVTAAHRHFRAAEKPRGMTTVMVTWIE